MSIKVYESSKRLLEKQNDVYNILNWSSVTPKMEAGPIWSLDYALRCVKPDVFTPLNPESKMDKVCDNDPMVWWVVTTVPVCFGWKNGSCKNVVVAKNGKVHNHCKFRHEHTSFIKVDLVTTEMLLKKMKNRTKKLRENGTKNKKKNYINPFTGIWYPCNYKKNSVTKGVNPRAVVVDNQSKLVATIKTLSPTDFVKECKVIGLFRTGLKLKKVKNPNDMTCMELDDYLRTSPNSIGGKSWADVCEESETAESKTVESENDGWTTITKGRKKK
jgi:hypothetical protein